LKEDWETAEKELVEATMAHDELKRKKAGTSGTPSVPIVLNKALSVSGPSVGEMPPPIISDDSLESELESATTEFNQQVRLMRLEIAGIESSMASPRISPRPGSPGSPPMTPRGHKRSGSLDDRMDDLKASLIGGGLSLEDQLQSKENECKAKEEALKEAKASINDKNELVIMLGIEMDENKASGKKKIAASKALLDNATRPILGLSKENKVLEANQQAISILGVSSLEDAFKKDALSLLGVVSSGTEASLDVLKDAITGTKGTRGIPNVEGAGPVELSIRDNKYGVLVKPWTDGGVVLIWEVLPAAEV